MDEPTVEERLAALRARRGGASPQRSAPPLPPQAARSYDGNDVYDDYDGGYDQDYDASLDDRLAALQARRQASAAPSQPAWDDGGYQQPAYQQPAYQQPAHRQPVDQTTRMDYESHQPVLSLAADPADQYDEMTRASIVEQLGLDRLRLDWSPSRFVAAGASVVSFGAMVVAMGPLLAEAESTEAGSTEGADAAAQPAVPEAPGVEIGLNSSEAVDPALGTQTAQELPAADGSGGTIDPSADTSDPAAGSTSEATAVASTAAPSTVATAAPSTAAPTTAPPATNGGTQAPTTAPPTSAAPTTAPPTTPPPSTAAPTTAAPTTTPTTPPTTEGSPA
jgi:hypothetical protein